MQKLTKYVQSLFSVPPSKSPSEQDELIDSIVNYIAYYRSDNHAYVEIRQAALQSVKLNYIQSQDIFMSNDVFLWSQDKKSFQPISPTKYIRDFDTYHELYFNCADPSHEMSNQHMVIATHRAVSFTDGEVFCRADTKLTAKFIAELLEKKIIIPHQTPGILRNSGIS